MIVWIELPRLKVAPYVECWGGASGDWQYVLTKTDEDSFHASCKLLGNRGPSVKLGHFTNRPDAVAACEQHAQQHYDPEFSPLVEKAMRQFKLDLARRRMRERDR